MIGKLRFNLELAKSFGDLTTVYLGVGTVEFDKAIERPIFENKWSLCAISEIGKRSIF